MGLIYYSTAKFENDANRPYCILYIFYLYYVYILLQFLDCRKLQFWQTISKSAFSLKLFVIPLDKVDLPVNATVNLVYLQKSKTADFD